MNFTLWQVDAFAAKPLEGNPAAIVPLQDWLDDALMQRIALENNLSETAFLVPQGKGRYGLRWFTPASEVDLCGHATLASAYVIFAELAPDLARVDFETRSGMLSVEKGADGIHRMSMPADPVAAFAAPSGFEARIGAALGVSPPREIHLGRYALALWNDAATVRDIRPTGQLEAVLASIGIWGLIATARGDGGYDFVSRFFAPAKGVAEDPVTGSAHCALAPFWARRLEKTKLKARQVSPRGGDVTCEIAGERVILSGPCALYLKGETTL